MYDIRIPVKKNLPNKFKKDEENDSFFFKQSNRRVFEKKALFNNKYDIV